MPQYSQQPMQVYGAPSGVPQYSPQPMQPAGVQNGMVASGLLHPLGDRANFTGLVLDCIEATFCN